MAYIQEGMGSGCKKFKRVGMRAAGAAYSK
jgi:hypothetical protein